MRTFYELHGRGLVSLPRLATSQDVVNQTDPNTIVVGDTVFRITVPSAFNTETVPWSPPTAPQLRPPSPRRVTNPPTPPSSPTLRPPGKAPPPPMFPTRKAAGQEKEC